MDKLIALYAKSLKDEAEVCKNVDEQIKALQNVRAGLASTFVEARKYILVEVTPMVLALGKSYKCDAGTAQFTKGRVTRSWDLDGLDALEVVSPALWEQIYHMRRETIGEPRVSIKVKE